MRYGDNSYCNACAVFGSSQGVSKTHRRTGRLVSIYGTKLWHKSGIKSEAEKRRTKHNQINAPQSSTIVGPRKREQQSEDSYVLASNLGC